MTIFILMVIAIGAFVFFYSIRERTDSVADFKNDDLFLDKSLRTIIAGTAFRNEDGTERQKIINACKVGDKVAFLREPKNKYDKDAVAVISKNRQQIGYLPSAILGSEPGSGYNITHRLDSGQILFGKVYKIWDYDSLVWIEIEIEIYKSKSNELRLENARIDEARKTLLKPLRPSNYYYMNVAVKYIDNLELNQKLLLQFSDSKEEYLENPERPLKVTLESGELIGQIQNYALGILRAHLTGYAFDAYITDLTPNITITDHPSEFPFIISIKAKARKIRR
jgi:hypothetical protein